MFRNDPDYDKSLSLIYTASQMYEAEQIREILEQNQIPCMIRDREDVGQYLRILGLGSPYGLDLFVNAQQKEAAEKVLDEYLTEEGEELSEEELENAALQAVPGEGEKV